uniref:AB hydrolase-1 domain-containing protein n=1 Tax=Kalanchoe fedtschenkoi TaxID=63787 RepID=A0A7N0UJA5_KALFE
MPSYSVLDSSRAHAVCLSANAVLRRLKFRILEFRSVLRKFGDTDVPEGVENYTIFLIVGDVVDLLDAVAPDHKVFVVGHDWGAIVAWQLSLYRPDKVKALVNLSVAYSPRKATAKPVDVMRHVCGDDFYICKIQVRFPVICIYTCHLPAISCVSFLQDPGVVEAEFAELGTKRVLAYTSRSALLFKKRNLFGHPKDAEIVLPDWVPEEEVDYYTTKFTKTGFTGGLNFYRAINLNWELNAPWTGCPVMVPTKFIVGDMDTVYYTLGANKYINSPAFKKDVPLLEEVVVMKGVAHWIQEEKADEVTKLIYDFFQKF